MLTLDLYRVFENKGIDNPHRFMKKNGFTPHITSRLLNNSADSISYKNLEQLCLTLNCTVDDLFKWTQGDDKEQYKQHALQKLIRKEETINLSTKIKELPVDKLNELISFIDKLTTPQK